MRMDIFVVDKRETCFEKSVIFHRPVIIEGMSDDIAVIHFAKNETIYENAFIFRGKSVFKSF